MRPRPAALTAWAAPAPRPRSTSAQCRVKPAATSETISNPTIGNRLLLLFLLLRLFIARDPISPARPTPDGRGYDTTPPPRSAVAGSGDVGLTHEPPRSPYDWTPAGAGPGP